MNNQYTIQLITFLISALAYLAFDSTVFVSAQKFDNSPPSITIIDPMSGSSMHDNIIVVNGTSYDDESGIRKVEVLLHPYPFDDKYEFEIANPISYNNWSKWSIPISIVAPGIYRILAHAEDKAGNENWHESTVNVPFFASNKSRTIDLHNFTHIAFVNPVFTDAAYGSNAFYDFYAKYQSVPWGRNITTDLDMLKADIKVPVEIDPHAPIQNAKNSTMFSNMDSDNNHIIILSDILMRNMTNGLVTVIRDEDVHNGYIFNHNEDNAYDILVLSHDEYVTSEMYQNYKRFVNGGGVIIFLDGNVFYAEVKYDKKNHTITLVKGHNWEFDGKTARKGVAERWFYENSQWVGSNFLMSHINDTIYFRNNPFNYTHFEENYVSNPMARILIDYEVDLSKSVSPVKNVTVAAYELDVGRGKVFMTGLFGQRLVNNTAFLTFFQRLLLNSGYGINDTNFEAGQNVNYRDISYGNDGDNNENTDKFGITKIYPTKDGGQEWYVDMNDPMSDGKFFTRAQLTKQPDGSWRADGHLIKDQIRLEVNTSENIEGWKNVEITGYGRVVRTTGHEHYVNSDLDNVFQWYARGGKHSDRHPCEGSSLKGRMYLNGDADWIKEIWHTGGYTEENGRSAGVSPLIWKNDSNGRYYDGKWFGFKVIIFNLPHNDAVSMESYIDSEANNNWTRISSLIDNGTWYSYDPEFYNIDCNRPRNYVITDSGPIAGFRTDNIIWDFKYLSIREISTRA